MDEFLVLKEMFDDGFCFEDAYEAIFEDDTAFVVEAFELWSDLEAKNAK